MLDTAVRSVRDVIQAAAAALADAGCDTPRLDAELLQPLVVFGYLH